jgi:hypothetical protein
MAERATLVRIAALSRLLRESLYELEAEFSTAPLAQELSVLQERVESELGSVGNGPPMVDR